MSDRIHPAAIEATGYVGNGAQYLADDGTWKVAGGGGQASIFEVVIAEPAGTDVTAQIQDAINTAVSAGQDLDLLILPTTPGPLLLNGAVQTGTALTVSYAGQILLPARPFDSGRLTIRLRGATPAAARQTSRESSTPGGEPAATSGTVLLSNATSGYILDAIPADTIFSVAPLTDLTLVLDDITFRAPNNPQCGGVNALNVACFEATRISIDVDAIGKNIAFPTGTRPGLVTPRLGNMALVSFAGQVVGFPVGIRHSEHTHIIEAGILNCAVALQADHCAHPAVYQRIQISKCPTVLQAYGTNDSHILGRLDYEAGADSAGSWAPSAFIDDVDRHLYGDLEFINTTDLTKGFKIKPGGTGPLNLNLRRVNTPDGGWRTTTPWDTFTRNASLVGATGQSPGIADKSLHPWSNIFTGAWQFATSGSLSRSGANMAGAVCPYYLPTGGDAGWGSRIVKAKVTTGSTYTAGLILSYDYATKHHLRVSLGGGIVTLSRANMETVDATLATGGTVAASTAYTVKAVLRFDPAPGGARRVLVYVNGALAIDYTLTTTDESYLTVADTQLRGDGVFTSATDVSTFSEFRVVPVADTEPTSGGSGSGMTIQDEDGNVATGVTQIDFQGAGVTATAGTGEAVVTVPGGGGGGSATFIGCAAVRTASQSIANGAITPVQFNGTDEYDTSGIHDAASNNTRFTIPTGMTGVWRFTGSAWFDAYPSTPSASASDMIGWRVNGTDVTAPYGRMRVAPVGSTSVTQLTTSIEMKLTAGDYVEFTAFQGSGGNLNVGPARCSCHFLGSVA